MDKRSPTWTFFKICEDNSKVMCKLCSTVISRGSASAKTYTTTALNNHLPYKQPQEFKEVVNSRTTGAASKCSAANVQQSQPTLAEVVAKRKSVQAWSVHFAIVMMIAVDIQA